MRWITRTARYSVLVTVFMLVFAVSGASCQAAGWNIPFIGVFQSPEGMHAAEFKDLKNMLDTQIAPKAKGKMDKKEMADPKLEQVTGLMKQMDLAAYQLTIDDGDGYHQSYVMAARFHQGIEEAADFFQVEIPDKQKAQIADMIGQVNSNLDKMAFYDEKSKVGVKLLGVMPVQYLTIEGRQAYSAGARILLQAEDFWFPMSARAYVFSIGKQVACLIVFTSDSERAFWDRVFQEMVPSLQVASQV